mgnify:CR=1 FL=1
MSFALVSGENRAFQKDSAGEMRMMRDMIQKFPRKRLSCGPLFFSKKLQKSREMSNFTAFCGGLEGDRTLDLCDANAALSQLSYEPVFV